DLQTHAEWVAMWQAEQAAQERREAAEQRQVPVPYLDPEMQAAIEDAELEEAERREGGLIPPTMELSSALTLRNRRAPPEHREFAAAYLRVCAEDRQSFRASLPAVRSPSRVRP